MVQSSDTYRLEVAVRLGLEIAETEWAYREQVITVEADLLSLLQLAEALGGAVAVKAKGMIGRELVGDGDA